MPAEPTVSPITAIAFPSWQQCTAMLESATTGFLYLNSAGEKVYANPRYHEILGLSLEETRAGAPGWTYLHPDDLARVHGEWEASRVNQHPFVTEYRVKHRDGHVAWVGARLDPIRGPEGGVIHWSGVLVEITGRKEAEKELLDKEARLKLLIEQVPATLWTTDTELRFTSSTGYPRDKPMFSRDELIGRAVADLFKHLDAQEAARYLEPHHTALAGQSASSEGDFGGFYFQSRVDPLRDADGQIIGTIGLAIDISERRKIEEQLRQSQNRLEMIFKQIPLLLWTTDRNLRFTSTSGWGSTPPSLWFDDPMANRTIQDSLESSGETAEPALSAHHRALSGESVNYQVRVRESWLQATVEPLRSAEGVIIGTIGAALDITSRIAAETALREAHDQLEARVVDRTRALSEANTALEREAEERARLLEQLSFSEERYAGMLKAQQTLVARSDLRFRLIYQNEAYERALKIPLGNLITESIHPDDREMTVSALKSLQHPPHIAEFESRRWIGGAWRWVNWQYSVIRDRHDRVVELQAVGFDVNERHAAEAALRQSEEHFREAAETNRRLLYELDHRVRNNIAGLLGLVERMRRQPKSVEDFAIAITGRLAAMTHSQQLLSSTGWRWVNLTALMTSLVSAARAMACAQATESIDGPDAQIPPGKTSALAMILFEWLTNSCKYGAHSVDEGRLTIRWSVNTRDGVPWVQLHWTERNGPVISQVNKSSLGTVLVREFTARQLGGRVELNYPPAGAQHVLEFPLSA